MSIIILVLLSDFTIIIVIISYTGTACAYFRSGWGSLHAACHLEHANPIQFEPARIMIIWDYIIIIIINDVLLNRKTVRLSAIITKIR